MLTSHVSPLHLALGSREICNHNALKPSTFKRIWSLFEVHCVMTIISGHMFPFLDPFP